MTDGRPRSWRVPAMSRGLAAGLDVGFSSLSNLLIGVAAARALSLADFGAYSTAFLVGTILLGLVKSLTTDPLILNFAAAGPRDQIAASGSSLAASALLGAILGPAVTLVTWLVLVLAGSSMVDALTVALTAGLIAPVLSLQETARGVAYCQSRIWAAVVNNGVRLLSLPAVLFLVPRTLGYAPAAYVAAWGASAATGFVAAWLTLGRPRSSGGSRWLRSHWRLARRLLADFGLTMSSAHGALLIISSVAGAEAIGAVRKAQLVLAPVTLLTSGALTLLQPAWVRQVARGVDGRELLRKSYSSLSVIAALTGCWVLLIMLLPVDIGTSILGEGWQEARQLMPVSTLYALLGAAGGLLGISLRALGVVKQQVRWRMHLAAPTLVAVALLSLLGPYAALVGLCASLFVVVLIWHLLLLRADRTVGTTEEDS